MNKKYFLLYGSYSENLTHVTNLLSDLFGIEFVKRDSSFLGEYYIYNGEFIDQIIIQSNKKPELKKPKFYNFNIIVECSFLKGQNVVKELKVEQFINKINKNLNELILLRESIVGDGLLVSEINHFLKER